MVEEEEEEEEETYHDTNSESSAVVAVLRRWRLSFLVLVLGIRLVLREEECQQNHRGVTKMLVALLVLVVVVMHNRK